MQLDIPTEILTQFLISLDPRTLSSKCSTVSKLFFCLVNDLINKNLQYCELHDLPPPNSDPTHPSNISFLKLRYRIKNASKRITTTSKIPVVKEKFFSNPLLDQAISLHVFDNMDGTRKVEMRKHSGVLNGDHFGKLNGNAVLINENLVAKMGGKYFYYLGCGENTNNLVLYAFKLGEKNHFEMIEIPDSFECIFPNLYVNNDTIIIAFVGTLPFCGRVCWISEKKLSQQNLHSCKIGATEAIPFDHSNSVPYGDKLAYFDNYDGWRLFSSNSYEQIKLLVPNIFKFGFSIDEKIYLVGFKNQEIYFYDPDTRKEKLSFHNITRLKCAESVKYCESTKNSIFINCSDDEKGIGYIYSFTKNNWLNWWNEDKQTKSLDIKIPLIVTDLVDFPDCVAFHQLELITITESFHYSYTIDYYRDIVYESKKFKAKTKNESVYKGQRKLHSTKTGYARITFMGNLNVVDFVNYE